jgi:hypothetical protein
LGSFSIPVADLNASNTPIIIELQNNNTEYVIKDSVYTPPQVKATDNYDGLPNPPWLTYESTDFVGDRLISINMAPGRTKVVKFNVVAIDFSGNIYYANPDYVDIYYNRRQIMNSYDGTWSFNMN